MKNKFSIFNFQFSIFLILATYYILHTTYSFAQSKSNTVRVKVGTPQSDLVKAAQDLHDGYHSSDCNASGYTFDPPDLSTCLKTFLLTKGYSEDFLKTFETRRQSSLISHVDINRAGKCTECLPFVALALTLTYSQPRIFLDTFGTTSSIYNSDGFTIGTITYERKDEPQPDDVAATSGHLMVVKSLVVDEPKFYAVESNWGYSPGSGWVLDCKTTDNLKHEIKRSSDTPHFFRKK